MLDVSKRARGQKAKKIDELARDDNLSVDAKVVLQDAAKLFLESCFNRMFGQYIPPLCS